MAKQNNNNTANTATERSNKKDVVMALMFEGLQGVQSLYAKTAFSRGVVDGAIEQLVNGGKSDEADQLSQWSDEAFGPRGDGTRGRKPAAIGDSRTYLVQQVNDGSPFIRLPVDLLNAGKGATVTVHFADGKITVTG